MHGQTRIEFIFGIIIFSIIIFYIVTQVNTIFSSNISDYEINNLKAEANSIIEILTNDKGYPEDWVSFLSQGWEKRREIEITSSGELRNQQVRINVTYDSDMKPDFSDLRFTDSNKVTSIPYWIEDKSDNNWAVVWVKVPKIPEAGKKSIYMYYGSPLVFSESNGNSVFIQFLDLSGTSLPSGWVKTDIVKPGTATVSNGILRLININGSNVFENTYEATHVYKNSTISGDFVTITKIMNQNGTEGYCKTGISIQNFVTAKNYNGMAYVAARRLGDYYGFMWQSDSSYIAPNSYSNSVGTVNFPTYLKIVRNNSYVSGWQSYDNKNWVAIGSSRVPIAIEDLQYVTLFATPYSSSKTIEANFSMFYVYQYASPEPTGIIKNEETRINESWYPLRTVGLANQQNVLSKDKIKALNDNCNLLINFGLDNYRLKIYNSTNRLLFCGTDTLSAPKVVINKNVLIENDLGNVTLELW